MRNVFKATNYENGGKDAIFPGSGKPGSCGTGNNRVTTWKTWDEAAHLFVQMAVQTLNVLYRGSLQLCSHIFPPAARTEEMALRQVTWLRPNQNPVVGTERLAVDPLSGFQPQRVPGVFDPETMEGVWNGWVPELEREATAGKHTHRCPAVANAGLIVNTLERRAKCVRWAGRAVAQQLLGGEFS